MSDIEAAEHKSYRASQKYGLPENGKDDSVAQILARMEKVWTRQRHVAG